MVCTHPWYPKLFQNWSKIDAPGFRLNFPGTLDLAFTASPSDAAVMAAENLSSVVFNLKENMDI